MHISTIIPIVLTTLSITLPAQAASHDSYRGVHRRRHAARASAAAEKLEAAGKRDDTCTNGSWTCVGTELQRCYNAGWHLVQNCTGENIICSADDSATGCIWTWSLPSTTSTSAASSAVITSGTGTLVTTGSNVTLYNTTTGAVSSNATSTNDGEGYCDDGEEEDEGKDICDDGDDTVTSSTVSAVATVQTDDGDDYDDCDDDDDSDATLTGSAISTALTASSTSTSAIGGALYVGQHGGDVSSTTDWYSPTVTDVANTTASFTDGLNSTAIPTASMTDFTNITTYTTSTISSKHKHHGSTTSTSALSAITSTPSNATSGIPTFSAPHYVIYADEWLTTMPSASDLAAYNRFILAFWMSDTGAVDDAQAWAQFDADYRQDILDTYHAAGIALMVSAFGSTDTPTGSGMDPTTVAQELSAWVVEYGLDGVDIDYEDMGSMNNNVAEAWLITFQKELRSLLPSPYIISHAPVAPWFTSAPDYAEGAYVKIHQEVGHLIDFYNVQFYNQGTDVYCDCNSLIKDSGSSWPSTSVFEINSYAGVPLEKIVIGKPLDEGAATNGYMTAAELYECVIMAQDDGWNAGVMFWEWTGQAPTVMATVRGS